MMGHCIGTFEVANVINLAYKFFNIPFRYLTLVSLSPLKVNLMHGFAIWIRVSYLFCKILHSIDHLHMHLQLINLYFLGELSMLNQMQSGDYAVICVRKYFYWIYCFNLEAQISCAPFISEIFSVETNIPD